MKQYLLESEIQYSKEERKAFLEKLKTYGDFRNEIYRSKKLREISKEVRQMIESAEVFTMKENEDEWFDNVTISRDMKGLKDSCKLFEKTCQEISVLQQRLEACYENIGQGLGRYYDV